MIKMAKIDEWALHAFVDNEVAGEGAAEIQEFLKTDTEAASTVESWRHQREALKRGYDGVLDEALPPALAATLRHGGSWRNRPFMNMAAALALVVLGALGGWFTSNSVSPGSAMAIADQALVAHEIYAAEVKHPVEVVAAEKDHLQAWLSKRIGTPFVVPDLTAEGYTLLGGRLLAADDRPAAQLMYEDAGKKRITIFLTANPAKSETALRVEQKGALIACYWMSEKLGFALAGEMDKEPMMRLARIVYDKFEG